ncbi:BAG family molecular chaperone regulator 4-like [Abrus precatorius]|uniref:BAG family molecular chaperone regulator 4-like n=1 Tax=Abrus precatorius TaxID=3816 RepID=A0A8B8LE93_ABRPR|nr:BAG family molecular chaperone regulator 4-like [Abrus precatorius]
MENAAAPASDEVNCETSMFVQRGEVGVDEGEGEEPIIMITVSHGSSQHHLYLLPHFTFWDVKKLLATKIGLLPEEQRLFFRGKEKYNEEHLNMEGVKDKSKLLLLEDAASKERKLEKIRVHNEMLKAFEAIAAVRAEVDELCEMVSALEVAVDGGTKVSDKEFVVSTELLMRNLLKLDGIVAEGETKLQRKAEVRRVQNFVDKLDSLKAINSRNL